MLRVIRVRIRFRMRGLGLVSGIWGKSLELRVGLRY
jgi:hypothetical protein